MAWHLKEGKALKKNIPFVTLIGNWLVRYFSSPDVVVLSLFLMFVFVILHLFGHVLEPLLLSVGIAYVLDPLVRWLKRLKCPASLAVALVFLTFISTCIALLLLLVPLLWHQATALVKEVPSIINQSESWLATFLSDHPDFISGDQFHQLTDLMHVQAVHVGKIVFSYSLSSVASLVTVVLYLVLVPTMVFFLLKDKTSILSSSQALLPDHRSLITQVWSEVNGQIGQYIKGRVLEVLIVSLVSGVTFMLMGLPYAALMGVCLGISVIIPYVGAFLVSVPVVLLALLKWGVGMYFGIFLGVFVVIIILDAYVLVPVLFSGVLNLSPMVIIVSVIIFGSVWGFWGVFLAIPLAAAMRSICVAVMANNY